MKHKAGDLVYYRANKRAFVDRNQPSIGVIIKCNHKEDTYFVKWLNDDDSLYRSAVMTEFSGEIIGWFKRDLEEILKDVQ